MMDYFKVMWRCIVGPKVFRIPNQQMEIGAFYSPNLMEQIPDMAINSINICSGLIKWTCILWGPIAFRKLRNQENIVYWTKFVSGIVMCYWLAVACRGFGRILNPEYRRFIDILHRACNATTSENMELLEKYDCEFSKWPVQFAVSSVESAKTRRKLHIKSRQSDQLSLLGLGDIFSWLLAHTIGVRLAYPGCTGIMNSLVASTLRDTRIQHQKNHGIRRIKLLTDDNNEIEAFYTDRRDSGHPNGEILVIACEGNAGFPEVGCPMAPLNLNYSVIGWNHPGFAGSTGLPFPDQEQNAIDCIMQFALNQLGFHPDKIILYAWSIGGYSATWAAMNYPDVRSLVLDATFDDINKLSEKALPAIFYPLVLKTVNNHFDLNNAGQIVRYPGPIRLIRRTKDEMITTNVFPDLKTNRGNNLLTVLLRHRYPELCTENTLKLLNRYLELGQTRRDAFIQEQNVTKTFCEAKIREYVNENGFDFPMTIGASLNDNDRARLLLYLASRYMNDFDSTHCTPLNAELFKEGWSERNLGDNNGSNSSNSGPEDWEKVG